MSDDLVERLRTRAADDRKIQANNEAVAAALKGQRLLFDQGFRSDPNTFAVRLCLDYENCAKNDAKLAADWDAAADRIEALTAALIEARAEIALLKEALRPFAQEHAWGPHSRFKIVLAGPEGDITGADLDRARAALEAKHG